MLPAPEVGDINWPSLIFWYTFIDVLNSVHKLEFCQRLTWLQSIDCHNKIENKNLTFSADWKLNPSFECITKSQCLDWLLIDNDCEGVDNLLSWHRRPSGKQSLPVPFSGSLPQSRGNISSLPVACGDSVPSSTNLCSWSWSCPMIMCITPCMKGWNTLLLKLWIGWAIGWMKLLKPKLLRKPNPETK